MELRDFAPLSFQLHRQRFSSLPIKLCFAQQVLFDLLQFSARSLDISLFLRLLCLLCFFHCSQLHALGFCGDLQTFARGRKLLEVLLLLLSQRSSFHLTLALRTLESVRNTSWRS